MRCAVSAEEKAFIARDGSLHQRHAMRFAFQNLSLVVEPGGAVGLAAVLAGKVDTADRTTAVVLSGGNVDRELFAEIQADSN